MWHRNLLVPLVVASLAVGRPALADESAENRAAADALYEQAGKFAEAKRWVEACNALEASLKLDPAYGTLMRLGSCYEALGRNASAWSSYNDALGLATKNDDKRAKQAAQEARRLEPTLARILVAVSADGRPAGLEIRRNGTIISAGAWGTPVPVDPGTQTFDAKAPGKKNWQVIVEIPMKPGVTTVQVPVLEDAPQPEAGTPTEAAPFWSPRRVAGVAVGSAGVVGIISGAILGALAEKTNNDSKSQGHCNQSVTICDATGLQMQQSVRTMAHGSTAGFVIGGAALVTGVVLLTVPPSASPGAPPRSGARVILGPVAGATMAGMVLRGGW